jgi:hypothetical protein
MICNKNCIHYLVCKLKELDFANIDECQYYEKPIKFMTSADRRIETMKHFVHVTINDPKYGEVDGWLDKARQLLFTDAVTTDFAKRVLGWTWKETDNEVQKETNSN